MFMASFKVSDTNVSFMSRAMFNKHPTQHTVSGQRFHHYRGQRLN